MMTNETHTLRYTGNSMQWSSAKGYAASRDDRLVTGVAPVDAKRLVEQSEFEYAGERPVEETTAPEPDEWADWNEDDWLDLGYTQRAEDVAEGRVDDHLGAIIDVETSDTVKTAVRERRDALDAE